MDENKCALSLAIQSTHNVVATSQRRTTNTQRCSNGDTTTSKLQQCFNVASTLIVSSIHCECCMENVAAKLKLRHQIRKVFATPILPRQIHNVLPTFPQRWIVSSHHSILWML